MFFGHGICYIPGIIYIQIRASPTSPRLFKMSLVHFVYLLGFAIGTTLTSSKFILFSTKESYHNVQIYNFIITQFYIVSLILLGFLINHFFLSKNINFKTSLDSEFQRINDQEEIFTRNEYQMIPQQLEDTDGMKNSSDLKIILRKIFGVFSKTQSLIYFFYPFHYMNVVLAGDKFYITTWVGVFGAIISSFVLLRTTQRNAFMTSCLLNIFALILITNFINSFVILYFSFFCFGFGFSYADLNIVSLVSFNYQEFILFMGYCFEMIFIGEIYANFGYDPERLVYTYFGYLDYILPMTCLFVALSLGSLMLMPNMFKKSVIEIQDSIK